MYVLVYLCPSVQMRGDSTSATTVNAKMAAIVTVQMKHVSTKG